MLHWLPWNVSTGIQLTLCNLCLDVCDSLCCSFWHWVISYRWRSNYVQVEEVKYLPGYNSANYIPFPYYGLYCYCCNYIGKSVSFKSELCFVSLYNFQLLITCTICITTLFHWIMLQLCNPYMIVVRVLLRYLDTQIIRVICVMIIYIFIHHIMVAQQKKYIIKNWTT